MARQPNCTKWKQGPFTVILAILCKTSHDWSVAKFCVCSRVHVSQPKSELTTIPAACSLAACLFCLLELPNSLVMNPDGCCSIWGVEAGVAGRDLLEILDVWLTVTLVACWDLVTSVGLLLGCWSPGIGKAAGAENSVTTQVIWQLHAKRA